MSKVKSFLLCFMFSSLSGAFAEESYSWPEYSHEDLYLRSSIGLAADRLYQREKKVLTNVVSFIDSWKEFSDLSIEDKRKKRDSMILSAALAVYPIIESFPSKTGKSVVLPQFVSALSVLAKLYEVESMQDLPLDSKEVHAVLFFLLQEANSYSEYLLHDRPAVISDYNSMLSETLLGLKRKTTSCDDIDRLERLEPIRLALLNTADIDRTQGLVLMIDGIFGYFQQLRDSLDCEG